MKEVKPLASTARTRLEIGEPFAHREIGKILAREDNTIPRAFRMQIRAYLNESVDDLIRCRHFANCLEDENAGLRRQNEEWKELNRRQEFAITELRNVIREVEERLRTSTTTIDGTNRVMPSTDAVSWACNRLGAITQVYDEGRWNWPWDDEINCLDIR